MNYLKIVVIATRHFYSFDIFLKNYENDEKLLVLITKYLICEIFMVKDTNLLIKA